MAYYKDIEAILRGAPNCVARRFTRERDFAIADDAVFALTQLLAFASGGTPCQRVLANARVLRVRYSSRAHWDRAPPPRYAPR